MTKKLVFIEKKIVLKSINMFSLDPWKDEKFWPEGFTYKFCLFKSSDFQKYASQIYIFCYLYFRLWCFDQCNSVIFNLVFNC